MSVTRQAVCWLNILNHSLITSLPKCDCFRIIAVKKPVRICAAHLYFHSSPILSSSNTLLKASKARFTHVLNSHHRTNNSTTMFESFETTLVKLRLHFQIIKIEYDHWVGEISERKGIHDTLTHGLQALTNPNDIRLKRKWVKEAGKQLQDAENEAMRVQGNMEETTSLIQRLDRDRWRKTVGDEFQGRASASSRLL